MYVCLCKTTSFVDQALLDASVIMEGQVHGIVGCP